MAGSLPRELNSRSHLKAVLGICWALLLFFGSWFAVTQIGFSPLALPFLIAGGYGMLLLGFMGHDGTHFSLHENKIVSSCLGILLTAPIFPYMVMGFTISHWNHHKHTNTNEDPDSVLFAKFKNLLTRSFLARPYSFWEYGTNTLRLAVGVPLPFKYQFPLTAKELQGLARVNVLLSLAWGALYTWVAFHAPQAFTALLAVYLFGTVLSGLSPYIEHTGTGVGRGVDTRTSEGWWWDFFILGNNYHVEHHLYPTVPFYNLKRVHQHLKREGYYTAEKYLSVGVWDTYRYTLKKYPYPLNAS